MTKNRMNSFLSLCSTPLLTKIRNAETFDVYTKDSPDGPPFLTRIVCECEAMVICDHELYAFSKFEEDGIFNETTGKLFLENILEKGGSQEPMELFVAFRGRKPTPDALLRHCGLKKAS